MPKLWNETIEAHRRQVHDAILDAAAGLVVDQGLRSVTMSQIAETAGIGRATLYKYFPDVETILHTWHTRQITAHLRQLTEIADEGGAGRLEAVLEAYALITHRTRGSHEPDLVRFLHSDEQAGDAQRRLHVLVTDLIAAEARRDVPAEELAGYCLHALAAAADLPSEAAVHRLVEVTLTGLRG